jgi:hypothetical protein
LISKGFLNVSPLWVYFTLVCSASSTTLPYSFSPTPHFSTAFNIYPYTSTFTDVMYYIHNNIADTLSFPFPPPSSIKYFHYYRYVLTYTLLYDLFLHICLSFWSTFYIWEKTGGLYLSELDLLHLTWCPPIASIYLQTTWCHSSLLLSITPLYVSITFSWPTHQL